MYSLYFLLKNKTVVYIGVSKSLKNRLQTHKYEKDHDDVRVIKVKSRKKAYYYETRWIKKFKPLYNRGLDSTGRKPVKPEEKVILVGFYTKKGIVDKVGGMSKAREIAKDSIENYEFG